MKDIDGAALTERLGALATLVEDGEGLLAPDTMRRAEAVLDHSASRLRHGTEHTVIALAGATGSGKSSLFNAVVGEQVAAIGVKRPTTSQPRAAIFGATAPSALLDWLEVTPRHGVDGSDALEGLVLIDLPDHDSVVTSHRLEVDRLVELVDVLVWVLDPQKYADEAIHDGYLRSMAEHADVMVFVLNQVDLVPPEEREHVKRHLTGLLQADGIANPVLVATSTVTGEGLDDVLALLGERISARDAALRRLDADLRDVAGSVGDIPVPGSRGEDRGFRSLVSDLSAAAGADMIAEAVAAGYRYDARLRTGWPFSRWLLRFRRHPLRILRGDWGAIAPSAPSSTAVPVDQSRLALAVKDYADGRVGDAPPAWLRRGRFAAASELAAMSPRLSSAVAGSSQRAIAPPRWWRVVGGLQRTIAAVALVGVAWLVLLGVLGYLRIPAEPFEMEIRSWPLPTLLLVGGVLIGLLVALAARPIASIGGRRRGRRAISSLAQSVEVIGAEMVRDPVDHEMERWRRIASAAALLRG